VLAVLARTCREKKSNFVQVKQVYKGRLGLLGSFQKLNAATAVAVAGQLRKQGLFIPKKAIEKGLAKAKWPGRFQIVQRRPTIVLDCCHNPGCCPILVKAFREKFSGKKALLVIGVSREKKISSMAKQLSPISKKVFATSAAYRALDKELVARAFKQQGKQVETVDGVKKAVKKAVSEAKANGVVLVTGSCFVVGEAMQLFSE